MTEAAPDVVWVETPARLHFGVLDLRGAGGRWFGGIGAAAPAPVLRLSARRAPALEARGADGARAGAYARRYLAAQGIDAGAIVHVEQALPAHAGLGSGTQLALAVARALAEVFGRDTDPVGLARAVGRGRRSGIGTWTFAGGGLVVEGGQAPDGDAHPPLVVRMPFPASWRCVVAVPDAPPGVYGPDEATAFRSLPPPPEREVERVAHRVLMGLLPAVAEGDVAAFGAALTEIQRITGRWFAPAQGGVFAPGPSAALVAEMAAWGASGVGQSSWGPAVYAIVDGDDAATCLADRVRAAVGAAGRVYAGAFRADGARVWREPAR